VCLGNCVGVIDSDYHDKITINLTTNINDNITIKRDDRITQNMIVAAPKISLIEIIALTTTERKINGFGSTKT
jgi:dUTPase